MQSGRIAPVFRQFFNTVSAKSATDSNSQQKQQEQKEPEREPTKKEAITALDFLTQQDEFQKNLLRAELREVEGRHTIVVTNATGAQLRVIRGNEVMRILEGGPGAKTAHLGRILDRRI
ncbi:MAG: hypothetical protein ACXVCS_04605 [Bdellovibrionota bacterium]